MIASALRRAAAWRKIVKIKMNQLARDVNERDIDDVYPLQTSFVSPAPKRTNSMFTRVFIIMNFLNVSL
jgi:hypothetical protein